MGVHGARGPGAGRQGRRSRRAAALRKVSRTQHAGHPGPRYMCPHSRRVHYCGRTVRAARARKRADRRRSRQRGRCRVRCAEASRRTTGPRTVVEDEPVVAVFEEEAALAGCSTMKSRSRRCSTRTSSSAPTAACPSCWSGSPSPRSRRSPSLRADRRTAGRRPIRHRLPWPWPARASRGQRSPTTEAQDLAASAHAASIAPGSSGRSRTRPDVVRSEILQTPVLQDLLQAQDDGTRSRRVVLGCSPPPVRGHSNPAT